METRRLSIVCLVLMVGLAGCSGISPFSGDQSGTATDTHDISYPDGYDESGITDPETAIDQHESVFNEADSLTLKMDVSTEISIFDSIINVSLKSDNNKDQHTVSIDGKAENRSFSNVSKYNSDGMTYEMRKMGNEPVEYEVYPEPFDSKTIMGGSFVSMWLTNATFGEATRDTHNGEQMFRYDVTDAESAEPFVIGLDEDPTLNDLNGTLTVDENGVVRSFSYTINYTAADGTDKTLSADHQITDINSTTVEEPDWVETAREQA